MSEMLERVMLALSNSGMDDVTEEDARAAIAAMREPTREMQTAAFRQEVSFRSGSGMSDIGQLHVEYENEPDKGASTIWRAMIDAALGDEG